MDFTGFDGWCVAREAFFFLNTASAMIRIVIDLHVVLPPT
jgi:hypothetical protein